MYFAKDWSLRRQAEGFLLDITFGFLRPPHGTMRNIGLLSGSRHLDHRITATNLLWYSHSFQFADFSYFGFSTGGVKLVLLIDVHASCN